MEEIIKDLTKELGFEEGVLTKDNLVEKVSETLKAKNTEVSTAQSEKEAAETKLTDAETKVSNLETENEKLSKEKDILEKLTTDTRTEATRLYKLCKGDKVDENIVKLIAEASLETAKSFAKQYQDEAEEKFSSKCTTCGQKKMSRQTAKPGGDQDQEDLNGDGESKTDMEVMRSLKARNKNKSRLFKDQ